MTREQVLVEAFLAGAADLSRRAPLLNRINVFPVVDADTGVNMSQTLNKATEQLKALSQPNLVELSKMLGPLLIREARGNSGVIFSQFLASFFEALSRSGQLTRRSFAAAAIHGRDAAYGAVSKPQEGTILTTASELARILADIVTRDKPSSHTELEARLARSVKNTPSLLPRLKQAGVVDSGALGFYVFASGLMLALPSDEDPEKQLAEIRARLKGARGAPLDDITDVIEPGFLKSLSDNELTHRYCVNILLQLPTSPPDDWKTGFEELGSCFDTATGNGLVKLHLHTDDPSSVRAAAGRIGEILKFEFDDMIPKSPVKLSGDDESPSKHMTLRVVGDSSMSLSYEFQKTLGIYRIENYVGLDGKMARDCDIDRNKMFAGMRDGRVYTTAQTSMGEVKDFVDRMMPQSDHLIYVAVGNAYTGTQNLMREVAKNHAARDRITIFDSRAASGQLGVICLAAAGYAAQTNDIHKLFNYINNQIATAREYLVIDDLKYLSRTGRIGRVKAALAGALGVKPIVGHGGDGAITHAKVRSREDAIREISERAANHPGNGGLLVMLEHTDNQEWVNEVKNRLQDVLPGDTEFVICPLSSTSAVHMGPGTWGVAVTRIPKHDGKEKQV